MKINPKLAYPALLGALATTSCSSVNLPKPNLPTLGLGKEAKEKRAQKKYLKEMRAANQYQNNTPAHLAYTQTNGKVTAETLRQMERTDPLNRVKFWSDVYHKNPNDGNAALSFVKALREINSHKKAAEISQHALVVHPHLHALKVEHGKALSSLGNTAEAVRVFREVLQQNPMSADAHAALGLTLERTGNSAQAQAAFQQAINLDPNRTETLSNFGMSLARSGNLPQAVQLLQKAYSQAPGDSKIQSNYALLLGMAGRFDEMRQVNLGIPSDLAAKNEAILRELNPQMRPLNGSSQFQNVSTPITQNMALQNAGLPLQQTSQMPQGYTPTPNPYQSVNTPHGAPPSFSSVPKSGQVRAPSQQNTGMPYGLNAARAALEDRNPSVAALPNTPPPNPATQSFYATSSASQMGQSQMTINQFASPPTSYGALQSPNFAPQSLPQPSYQPVDYSATGTLGGYQPAPYQTAQQLSVSKPPANPSAHSGRYWGAYQETGDDFSGEPNINSESIVGNASNLTGGYPYSAKNYFQQSEAKPEEAISINPPPLKGYAY